MTTLLVAVNAGPRLDRLPLTRWHIRIAALITAGLFLDTFELYSGGGVLAALIQTGWSTVSINATFLTVTFVGLVIGAWAAGVLGDQFGRRFCYQSNLALFGLASIAGSLAPDMTTLVVLRFFMGLGLGAEIVVGYATLAEFMPKASRGRLISAVATIVNLSFFISLVIAYYVIPAFGWRMMFLLPGVAAMAVWFARKSMPESPRWLESKGRVAEAEEVLRGIEAQAAHHGPLPAYVPAPAVQTEPVSVAVLFAPGVIRNTVVGIVINVSVGIALYGFLQWLPTVFVQRGLTLGSALQISMVMALGKSLGGLVGVGLADRAGRKASVIGSSVDGAALGFWLITTSGAMFLAVGFSLAVCIGIANTVGFTVYVPELFETRFRLRGAGLCGAVGRLASSGVQYGVVLVLAAGGLGGLTAALSGTLLVQAAVVGLLGVETKKRALDNEAVTAGGAAQARGEASPPVKAMAGL